MKLTNGKTLSECPHCGYSEYFVKVRMHGSSEYNTRFDGAFGDNTDLHDCLKYTEGKIAYCTNCRKRLGVLES